MSNLNKNQSFTASTWGAGGQGGARETRGGVGKDGEEFKKLSSQRGKTGSPEGFVASFVSPEKARAIASNTHKAPADVHGQDDLEAIRREAYEEAFAGGQLAGLEEGRKQSRDIIERMQDITADIEAVWTDLIQTHESRIIELVFRAVEKVVYGQAVFEQEMVKRAIIEALRVVPEPVNVQIAVNPKDYEYIDTVKEDFFSHIKALKDVSVAPDPAIRQGGCTVRTKFGEVDATLESRLEAIRECLLKANGKKVFK